MTYVAKRTLHTSKGVVAVGDEVPTGLPAEERARIRKAGGVADLDLKDAERLKKSLALVAEAEAKVVAAEKDEDKKAATAALEKARADHEKLGLW